MDKELKRQIILDNYQFPFNKEIPNNTYTKINSNNESCIDNIDIYFKGNDVLEDIKFHGEACAISTSATSIMLRNLIGKNKDEARVLIENYENMINELPYDKELLHDLIVYDEIYLQPNRKTCALIPVKAIKEYIGK